MFFCDLFTGKCSSFANDGCDHKYIVNCVLGDVRGSGGVSPSDKRDWGGMY